MALSRALQQPFEKAFERLVDDASLTAPEQKRGPSEVGWIENFHALAAANLDRELRGALRGVGAGGSIQARTALIHGNPFQIEPRSPLSRAVEAGDVLVVGERREGERTLERQALLLQMKVGPPHWSSATVSTCQQALLYGSWPPVEWRSGALRALPGAHPRTPAPGPCRAAQFGIIPRYKETGPCVAMELDGPARFAGRLRPRRLAAELAAASRLDLGVDATPGPADGWPRLVSDMLARAAELTFAGRLPRHSGTETPVASDAGRGRFLLVSVASGTDDDQGDDGEAEFG